jgi:hypothetical protein
MMTRYMFWFVALALFLSAISARADECGTFPPLPFPGPDDERVQGVFEHEDRGFEVTVPSGLPATWGGPPNPNHGVGILLSAEVPRAYLWAGAEYSEVRELSQVRQEQLALVSGGKVTVLSIHESPGRLGPTKAIRLVIRYRCRGLRAVLVQDGTYAVRGDERLLYKVELLTSEKRYAADRKYLRQVLASWHFRPIRGRGRTESSRHD